MKKQSRAAWFAACALAAAFAGLSPLAIASTAFASSSGQSHDSSQEGMSHHISIEQPFARATPGLVKNGAAFLTIRNTGPADRLLSAESGVAKRTELHTHLMQDGVMRMRRVEAIDVPSGGAVMLKPGGDHVMLMGLTAPLKKGQSFELTLIFEKAGRVPVTVGVAGVGAKAPHGDGAGHGHGHGHGHGGTPKTD